MTIIIVPTEKCNSKCAYCFEPQEQKNGLDIPLDINAIKWSLDEVWKGNRHGSDLCLHGGEPTLIPREALRDLVEYLHSKKGVVSIVTNASMVDDDMINLFREFNVYPGVSIDGPPELNTLRGPDPTNPQVTREYAEDTMRKLKRMRRAGLNVSIMCILHTENAGTPEKLDRLLEWMLELKHVGITGGRANPMFGNKRYELTSNQLTEAWRRIHEFNRREGTQWNPLREMKNNLTAENQRSVAPCVFVQCNIFNSVTLSVLPDGTIGNCDRTFKLGLYNRSKSPGKSGRYEALRKTQCRGCPYWNVCGGACPMEGFDDDWRNKSRFCEAYKATYMMLEAEVRRENPNATLSIDRPDWFFSGGSSQGTPHQDEPHGDDGHGDDGHMDIGHGDEAHGNVTHGDEGHGDVPHGDEGHGDDPHADSSHYDSPDWVLEEKQNGV